LTLRKFAPEHATIRRAISIEGLCQIKDQKGTKRPTAASPSSIKSTWARFKPVSHLWAAAEYEYEFVQGDTGSLGGFVLRIPHFLAIAEKLRTLGENHYPPRGRKNSRAASVATLDAETMWKAPTDLILPLVEVKLPAPTQWMMSALRDYKAER